MSMGITYLAWWDLPLRHRPRRHVFHPECSNAIHTHRARQEPRTRACHRVAYCQVCTVLVDTADNTRHEKRLPSLMEILPHIIPQLIRPLQFLDKVLNSILSQTEEIGPGNGVGMLPIANLIGRLDDHRPRTRRCPSDDGFRWVVASNYLELGAVSSI